MKSIVAASVATIFVIAASAAPAQAGGGITFGFGGGHGHGHHGHGHHGGIYLGFAPTVVAPGHNHWRKHVRWCFNHYDSYNPNTNMFKTVHGRHYCDSPFM